MSTVALGWASTGIITSSKRHLMAVEPFNNVAICGVQVQPSGEIRPRQATWCAKCVREARKLGIDPANVGLYDQDLSDVKGDDD